ncbi:hypothetical protein GCM10010193_15780 [Kitasatospora atroaurantiaca]|uniref:DUF4267 domain-containing protein n=1 Tax=Kitasatospora atroaurantiaca TaxID=285545 RepID=A0A561EIQ3_9ACTN|nr:hypothetical protein [Kitasatospora atroaurantiaca]TWE15463.1 hypothetical protein FB465_0357 [Kitasatospora atroaurantiaca]
MHAGLLRLTGAATALYGVTVALRPALLAGPSGLVDETGAVAPHTEVCLRPLAWRDAASGLAMVLAPEGDALRLAALVRIAADLGDAVLLGATLPRERRGMAVAVSAGWGALSVAGLLLPVSVDRWRAARRRAVARS